MNQVSAPSELEVDTRSEPRREKGTRLTGTWLLLARMVWGVLVIALLMLFVFSMPMYFSQLFTVSNGILYVPWQLTSTGEEALHSLGISLSFYAPCAFALGLFISCTWVAIAGILFWRKSDDWMALLAALIFVWWGTSNISVVFVPADWAWFFLNQASVLTIGNISVFLFFYLFPDGRFVPGWIGWLALLQFLILASQAFPSFPWNLNVWPEALVTLLMGSLVCGIAGSQIYRYRRLSSPVQRQQTKWVVFAFAVVFSGLLGDVLAVNVLNLPLPDLLVQLLDPILWHLVPILIPCHWVSPSCGIGCGTSTSSSTARWSMAYSRSVSSPSTFWLSSGLARSCRCGETWVFLSSRRVLWLSCFNLYAVAYNAPSIG